MTENESPVLGLVVPSLTDGGGVPAVAEFVKGVAERSGRYQLKIISLAMSSRDSVHVSIVRPRSWVRGIATENGIWQGRPFAKVGAFLGELEFQRYRPRSALTHELADCDLVQVVGGSPAWANSVVGLGIPVALQVATRAKIERRMRDAKPRSLADRWRRGMTRITDRMDDRALRRVDAIQVENLWMLKYAKEVNRDRTVDIRYAPPGIDTTRFVPRETMRLAAPYDILCVGRLEDPRKNVILLLEAFARLPDELRAKSRLVLAGSSQPGPEFWLRVKALGLQNAVNFVARPDDNELVQLYQQATVFALPSDEEGLGIVILEAMACGVPVVATRCGGPDGIITDGADGFLVSRGDATVMSARLHWLLTSAELNASMGARARATIEARYSEEVAGAAFVDVWNKLLKAAS